MENVKLNPLLLLVLVVCLVCLIGGVSSTRNLTIARLKQGCSGNEEITASPYGGGNSDNKPYSVHNIAQILVGYSIESLESISYIDKDDNQVDTGGGVDIAIKTHVINLDDGEYLTGVSGYIGTDSLTGSHDVITSVKFYTNLAEYGNYGTEGYKPFSIVLHCARITGFHGEYGRRIDTLGIYFVSDCAAASKVGSF